MVPLALTVAGREVGHGALGAPLQLDLLVPGSGPWEIELGVGKGRFLLARAAAHPGRRFLGVEQVSEYYRLVARRAARRGLDNLAVVRGEALYVAAALLPRAFAAAVHVYFPDPWPKTRHRRRRLFDAQSVDLVLGLLRPGGELFFATDYLDYGEAVLKILAGYPHLEMARLAGWPEGARTHYEAKYLEEGRPILRARGCLSAPALEPHPQGATGAASAWAVSAGRPLGREPNG